MKNELNEQLDRAREYASDAAVKIKDVAGRSADSLSRSKEKASEVYGEARDKSYKVATRANELIQEHPIAATAAAVAAGAALAILFPKSRQLIRSGTGSIAALGARASELTTLAVEALENHAEQARATASRAASDARIAIGDAGTKAAEVADTAFSRAKDVTASAADAAGGAVTRAKNAATAASSKLRK